MISRLTIIFLIEYIDNIKLYYSNYCALLDIKKYYKSSWYIIASIVFLSSTTIFKFRKNKDLYINIFLILIYSIL